MSGSGFDQGSYKVDHQLCTREKTKRMIKCGMELTKTEITKNQPKRINFKL